MSKSQLCPLIAIIGKRKQKEYQPYSLMSLMELIEIDAGSMYVSSEVLATSWPILVAGNDLSVKQWENIGRVLYSARALAWN